MLRPFRLAWLSILLFWSSNAYSQTGQGTLTGSVTDSSGAIISGVSVIVRNQNTGFTYNAVTTPEGIRRTYRLTTRTL